MSRFLEYGIFIPDASGSAATRPPKPNPGRWAKVGSKWMRVGPDGEPINFSSFEPHSDASSGAPRENISRSTPTVPATAADDVTSSSVGLIDPLTQTGGVEEDPADKRYGYHVEGLAAAVYENTSGLWETPPTTSSDCNDEHHSVDSGTSPNGRPPGVVEKENRSRRRGPHASDVRETNGMRESWARGSVGGGGAGEQLILDVDGEGERVPDDSTPGSTRMLTPGISRKYSKDQVVHKFFGEEANAEGGRDPAGNDARGTPNGTLECSPMSNSACVGERARVGGEGGSRRKENSGNSPSSNNGEKAAVEMRDVACQWDGSEMGDASDEEETFPQAELPDTPDCNALTAVLRLYDHARLENRRRGIVSSRPGWGVEESIENWDGVYLDTDDRVVALDVDGDPTNRQAVLIGPLPVELALMDHLEQLTMRRHRFKGKEQALLQRLRFLDGRIPAELGKLSRLTHLNLSHCRLIGFLPAEFGDLSNLVVLNVSWNFLSGDLPAELGRLTKLEELLLNSNAFSGPIPHEFGKLRSLQRFNAGHNIGLSGTLPPEMCRMNQLSVLDLRHNKIAGRIPPSFGRLANLQQLWLQDNQLNDEIPVELSRLQKLQVLNLTNNKLSGVIPIALRGHPKYMAFKILPGNVALGERVAPSEKEVLAASRRPPTAAMTHVSVARAKALQEQQTQLKVPQPQQRQFSLSMSPAREGVRRRTTGGDLPTYGEPNLDDLKRRSGGGGRNSLGRKVRSMKRIMGKKATPPVTPTRQRSRAGTDDSVRSRAGTEDSVRSRSSSSASTTSVTASNTAANALVQGKAFLEASSEPDKEDEGDGSPNPTASLSTGAGTSVNASPNSHDGGGEERDKVDGLLGDVMGGGRGGRVRGSGSPSLRRTA